MMTKGKSDQPKYRFAEIIDDLELIAFLIDRKGTLLYCNPYLLRLTGYSQKEILGQLWFDKLVPLQHRPASIKLHQTALETASAPPATEGCISTRTGSEIPIAWHYALIHDLHGNVTGLACLGENITRQRNVQHELVKQRDEYLSLYEEYLSNNEQLRSANQSISELQKGLETEREKRDVSEIKFQTLYQHTPIMLQSANMQGEIVSVNECWLQTMGYSYDEIQGTRSSDYLTPASQTLYAQLIPQFMANGTLTQVEAQAITKSGAVIDLLISSKILYDKQGNPMLTMTNLMDITYKKEVERQQEKIHQDLLFAKQKAEESSRLKTAFLQNLSHEIRTPLNAICGFAQLLLSQYPMAPRQERFHNIIWNSSNQLLSIVNNILTLASLETQQEILQVEELHLNELLDELFTIYTNQLSASKVRFLVHKDCSQEQIILHTDGTKLRQVLSNLINNAIKFTTQGKIELGYTVTDKQLVFYVKDSGIGIPKDKHEVIFERFRRLATSPDPEHGGTGLGLAISKAFVELLGGKIWVESNPGRGSCFYVSLPDKTTAT